RGQPLRGLAHPDHARGDDARRARPRQPREHRGGRHGQVRREAGLRRAAGRRHRGRRRARTHLCPAVHPGGLMKLSTIPEALEAIAAGRPVIVADSPERENEADVVLAASTATAEWVAWTIRHSSGYLCAPMPAGRADALELPLMVPHSQDPRRTAYT